MNQTRREVLKGTAWMGAAAFLAGCLVDIDIRKAGVEKGIDKVKGQFTL